MGFGSNYTGNATAVQSPDTAPAVNKAIVIYLPSDLDGATWANLFQGLKDLADNGTFLQQVIGGTRTAKGIVIDGVGGASGGVSSAGASHILIQQPGGSPSVATGTGAGTGPTVSATPGADATGILSITTGTGPVASGVIATITFANAYGSTPQAVILTPRNFVTAALSGTSQVVASTLSTTQWQIQAGSVGLAATTLYSWQFSIIG